ncbi:MAG: SpoIIE family protein phosphatase [bacterium]|nr:SpoIIE family protein phosphatase [bacterium]
MPQPVPTASPADAWEELADASQGRKAERDLLRQLLRILMGELGASVAKLVLNGTVSSQPELVVASDGETSGGSEALEVPVPGGAVCFEGLPAGSAATEIDGPRRAALAAAVRAFDQSEHVKRRQFEVNYRGVELDALYDVGLAIAATLNLDELSEEILLRAVSLLDARRGAFFGSAADEFRLEQTFGGSASERVPAGELERLLTGQTSKAFEVLPGSEHLLAVPIRVEREVKGLLVVADKESREGVGPFGSSDRRTLELFANQAAIALENAYLHRQALEKERLEREGELAAGIQKRLLPETTPEVHGFELTGWSRSARTVGGDYYNYIRLEEGTYFVVLGDVTGKGMPAALLVSTLDSALRLLLNQGLRREDLLFALNRHIFNSSASNTFITLAALELDSATGRGRYASGGHNPSLWLRAGQAPRKLGATGLPIGLFERATYSFEELEFESGDLLCLYSDGITECLSASDEEFGLERLEVSLTERFERPLAETADSICDQMTEFGAAGPRGDDQTVVLVRKS